MEQKGIYHTICSIFLLGFESLLDLLEWYYYESTSPKVVHCNWTYLLCLPYSWQIHVTMRKLDVHTPTHMLFTLSLHCHILNMSDQHPVYKANEEHSIVSCYVLHYHSVSCMEFKSSFWWNHGENQINLSLLTVVGFDPIWELVTQPILFVFWGRMDVEGGRSVGWEGKWWHKLSSFCLDTVQVRATKC